VKCCSHIALVALTVALPGLALFSGCSPPELEHRPMAAFIDQLHSVQPNPVLINRTTAALEAYGFEVDVYQSDEVNVDFYKKLPSYEYKLLIFRVHSGLLIKEEKIYKSTWLFTGEPYNRMKHLDERLNGRIVKARTAEDNPWVFAVGAEFVNRSTEGRFDGALIIMMGCYCFHIDDLAQAFIERGASAYMGWNGNVGLAYVDEATANLVDKLCIEDMTLAQAVDKTMAEIGPDPHWSAYLKYYPAKSRDKTIKELIR